MGTTPIQHPRRRGTALLFSALTSLALVLGLTSPASADEAPGDIHVYVTFEGYNLGQGHYIEPVKLTVPAGETAAQVTEAVLDEAGHDYADPGDATGGGWYLSKVAGFDTGTVNVPSYITDQPDFTLTEENGDGYLGEFDYSVMSGWMYTVDNVMAPVGAGAYELDDGDVIRWQFTMHGYGCDTGAVDGCWGGDPYFTMADKSELIRTLADPDPATATDDEIEAGLDVAIDPLATNAQVDAAIAALNEAEAVVESGPWTTVDTPAQGQFLNRMQRALRNDFGQSAGNYDYSVLEKLRVIGTLNSQDWADLRNPAYAGASIQELDLSGVVDGTAYALSGMTALTDVSLPPVASFTLANPFQGNTSLRNLVVAAETYAFGSATTFAGITTLERITFLHSTKPSMNAATFTGSNNADPENRTVTAVVPDQARGDYDKTTFTSYFVDVVETPSEADLSELRSVINEANAISEATVAAPFRWTLLQAAITAAAAVEGNPASTGAEVHRARLVLQTAISRVGFDGLGLSVKVTKGADLTLSWKNGTAQHYAEFMSYPVAKVDQFSDADHDVYVPTTPVAYTSQKIASALIEGETDKVVKIFTVAAASSEAQYTLNLTPLEGREDTSLSIPGLGAGDPRNLYTNLDDTGVVNLEVGEHFDLDTFRTSQAQLDQVNNLFIEPDYTFDVAGNSITAREIGAEGRRQLRIRAEQPGVSVVKVTYDPLRYLAANDNGTPGSTNWSFNGIEKQNTGLVVVKVGGADASFDTGIDVRNELDTFYFDRTVGSRPFGFTPAAGTSVRVHDPLNVTAWGDGWKTYQPAEDGEFTVTLKAGRNVIELTNDGETTYHVVRAKGIDVSIENSSRPGEAFEPGDVARISMVGVEGGIEKLGGIYNPAFMAGTKPKLTYSDGSTSITSNEGGQYTSVTTTYALDYTFSGDADTTLNGHLSIGGLGSEWPYHREIPLEGKPANLNAVAIGPYDLGGMPPVYVYGDQVTTRPGSEPVDKSALQAALAEVDQLEASDYTVDSWAALQAAVAVATTVAADDDATQDEVDASVQGVADAVAQLVEVADLVVTSLKATAPQVVYGRAGNVTVTVEAESGQEKPSGTVSTEVAGNTLTGTLADSVANLELPAKSLKPGTSSLTIAYAGVSDQFASSSTAVSVKVVKTTAKVTVKPVKKQVKRGKRIGFKVEVTAPGTDIIPTGKVRVKFLGRTATVKLNAKGVAKVKLAVKKKAKSGKRAVKAAYLADTFVKKAKQKTGKVVLVQK
ncbi:DUF4430 domain-containing protein [Nocardioides alcanivorans]|uniref:DUF4430 domain-containing protein n=1 Tax=Nocardioides alcanivorans TaxID=2897352 RepID=UPI001F2863CC|nr:DUF4430 domain-containing protein [Nocardioides alcanivorans]